jgi:hypothetical protein
MDSVQENRQKCAHVLDSVPEKLEDDFQIEYETCFFVVNEYLWT